MRRLAASVGMTFALGATGFAADVAPRLRPAAVPYLAPWSGVYVGLFAGGHWSRDRWTSDETNPAQNFGPFDLKINGFTGGVISGANIQHGNVVWGVETDLGWLTGTNTFNVTGLVHDIETIESKLRYNAHARIRGGYAFGHWLPFVAAGIAYADTRLTLVDTTNPPPRTSGSISLHRVGFTLGAGVDWMFAPNWIARAEYLHDRYLTANGAVVVDEASQHMELTSHIVRGAVMYKFGEEATAAYPGSMLKAPMAPVRATWAGVYAGAFAGGHRSRDRWSANDTLPAETLGPFDLAMNGFTGGALLGANMQYGNHVWGVEADFGLLTGSRTFGSLRTQFPGNADIDSIESKLRWNAHARVRKGYSFGQWMPFVASGAAFANTRMTLVDTQNGTAPDSGSISLDRIGFSSGAGVDWMFASNWIARVEYLYDRYTTASFQVPVETKSQHMQLTSHIVRGAVMYKFGDYGAMPAPGGFYKAPVAAMPAAWTGGYVGAFAGGHRSRDRWVSDQTNPPRELGAFDLKMNGGTFGGLIGANSQHGQLVWGVEADAGGLTGTNTFDGTGFPVSGIDSIETKMRWNAHGRLRFGYAAGDWMPFLAAGVAYADTRITVANSQAAAAGRPTNGSLTLNRVGFTMGAGIDWRFASNWIARVEYLHDRYAIAGLGLPAGINSQYMELRSDIVRGALIYKFGGGPVVAKY